jgi:lysozyme family protein
MNHFDASWRRTKAAEGMYGEHADDAGGATKYGVTEATARAHGYLGKMEDLPEQRAREIAKASYWDALSLDAVAQLSPDIAYELFDTGYNMHPSTAGKFIQRALNVLNRSETDFQDLYVDGRLGFKTMHVLAQFLKRRGKEGELVLLVLLNALQATRYVELAERRKQNESFVYGWALHRCAAQLKQYMAGKG